MESLLLFLSTFQLHAQIMSHGNIVAFHEFADSSEGRENFALFLNTAHYPTYLLADLIEEDFRQETVPHLTGRAHYALLNRKFEQYYRNTPFHQATLLQRQKSGRCDDEMLFSALTNPQLIKSWLDILLAQKTPLAGIYSVPQISAPLVRDHPSRHLLLISWEKHSGLRQTYFSHHRLQISRLSPVNEGLSFQQAVLEELPRTYQYLKSLSLLPVGQILDIRLLCHQHDLPALKQELQDDADMHYSYTDLEELARLQHIACPFSDSDASQIFLHQLAANPPKTHYASAEHAHYFKLWQFKKVLNLASGLILSVMLSWGIYELWSSFKAGEEAFTLKQQAQHTLSQAHEITKTFPTHLASAADMKAGVSVMLKHPANDAMPVNMLQMISAIMDRYPNIELDMLAWQIDPQSNAEVGVQFTIKGRLTAFENDYRAALSYLERFQHELAAQGCQVEVLTKPFDVSPGSSIADQRETSALIFSLKISRRAPI
jgi:hypothetical protein